MTSKRKLRERITDLERAMIVDVPNWTVLEVDFSRRRVSYDGQVYDLPDDGGSPILRIPILRGRL